MTWLEVMTGVLGANLLTVMFVFAVAHRRFRSADEAKIPAEVYICFLMPLAFMVLGLLAARQPSWLVSLIN